MLSSLPAYEEVVVEQSLPKAYEGGGGLIPDLRLEGSESRVCLELAWRSGAYAVTANRANMAAYVLDKLKAYALALGWTSA